MNRPNTDKNAMNSDFRSVERMDEEEENLEGDDHIKKTAAPRLSDLPRELKAKLVYDDNSWCILVVPKSLLTDSPRPRLSGGLDGLQVCAPVRTLLRHGWEMFDGRYVISPIPYDLRRGIGASIEEGDEAAMEDEAAFEHLRWLLNSEA